MSHLPTVETDINLSRLAPDAQKLLKSCFNFVSPVTPEGPRLVHWTANAVDGPGAVWLLPPSAPPPPDFKRALPSTVPAQVMIDCLYAARTEYQMSRTQALRLDHVAVAVNGLADVLPVYRDLFGLLAMGTEEVPDQKVMTGFLETGSGDRIELLEPTSADSPVSKFLEKRGPGLHHICFEVPDVRAAVARIRAGGRTVIEAEPFIGAGGRLVSFVHPKSAAGVLIELSEDLNRSGSR